MRILSGGLGLLLAVGPARSAAAAPAGQSEISCACPCAATASPASPPGTSQLVPAPPPQQAAFDLNRAGRDLYRQRRWQDARRSYAAAIAADPGFLAPRLNIACSFAQEERFAEAVTEASALLGAGYVPWAREIAEATDLAPLRARPEQTILRAAMTRAASQWGAPLPGALLFVARTGPAVQLPAAGVLVLALAQEIFAYLPSTGVYRQVTADDGRVLAFVRAQEGRSLVYVRAGKLLRADGQPPRLRGLALRRLDLTEMTLGPAVLVPGDVERLELGPITAAGTSLRVWAGGATAPSLWRFDGQTLLAAPGGQGSRAGRAAGALRLEGTGVAPSPARAAGPWSPCRFTVRDGVDHEGHPQVRLKPPGRPGFTLAAPHGAGLFGLGFPGATPAPARPAQ